MNKKTKEGVVESKPASECASAAPPTCLSEPEKIAAIARSFADIMVTLGLDPTEEYLRESPQRVARLLVHELFSGLNPANKPKLTTFPNHFQFRSLLVEKNIRLVSTCADHFLPLTGSIHVGYFPNKHIIGLSDIHKIADYYARRPQIQEQLTCQILEALQEVLETPDVIVAIHANHFCIQCRGTENTTAHTLTLQFGGKFTEDSYRQEFLRSIS